MDTVVEVSDRSQANGRKCTAVEAVPQCMGGSVCQPLGSRLRSFTCAVTEAGAACQCRSWASEWGERRRWGGTEGVSVCRRKILMEKISVLTVLAVGLLGNESRPLGTAVAPAGHWHWLTLPFFSSFSCPVYYVSPLSFWVKQNWNSLFLHFPPKLQMLLLTHYSLGLLRNSLGPWSFLLVRAMEFPLGIEQCLPREWHDADRMKLFFLVQLFSAFFVALSY